MSRFLLPITRNWIGEEFYGTKYALSVAAPHAVSPFVYAKCLLFASSASPKFPRAAAYCNGFLQALRSGAVDSDLVQYVEHFDRTALGKSPGLRKKDENELKVIRTLTPMQHRTMIYDAVKAAMYLNGSAAPNALKQVATGRQRLMERMIQVSATADSVYAQKHQQLVHHRQQHELGNTSTDSGGGSRGAPTNSTNSNGVMSNGQSNNNGSNTNNKPLSPTELELLAYQQQITNKGESKAHDLISASAPSASKDVLIHKNGKFYVPLDRLQEITQQQLLHEHHHYQKMHSMMGDQMSRYHQSLSSVVASTAGSTSATANSSSSSTSSAMSSSGDYSSPSSSSTTSQSNNNNGGGNGSSSKNSFVTSSSSISSALSASLRAKGGNRSAYVSGNLREAPRKKNNVVNSVHHHNHSSPTADDGNNNNNNVNSKTTTIQQQQQLQQQQNSSSETSSLSSSSIATSSSSSSTTSTSTSSSSDSVSSSSSSSEVAPSPSYDPSLECLREVFDEKQLCDLDTLGKELGLSPDVLIKACEIALRERDVTSRKAKLFEDLV